MNDEILKKLEARLDRRSFLRGSGLGVAALLGVAAASPLVVFAQEPQNKPAPSDKPRADDKSDKKEESTPKADEKPESKPDRVEGTDGKLYDRDGVEVRECPQCGHNMYQQGRTWTCENCGYSYIE
jgi:ribosomal protein S27AE